MENLYYSITLFFTIYLLYFLIIVCSKKGLNKYKKSTEVLYLTYKYKIDINNYNMLMNNMITNINYFERLNKERTISRNNNNAGYVNAIQMVVGLAIIIAFSICIAYLLYCIK